MVLLTLAVVAGVAAVVAGWVSGGLAEPVAQIPARALPPGPLTGDDVAALRFAQGLRGYRMDQVDAAMDGLAAEIERLRELLPEEVRDRDERFRVDAGRPAEGESPSGPPPGGM